MLGTDGNFTSTFTSTKPNGNLKEDYHFVRNSLKDKTVTDMTSGESVKDEYTYHATFKDLPTEIKTTQSKTGFSDVARYRAFTYNDWGGLWTETLPMTSAERNNATQKARLTTTYGYESKTVNGVSARIPKSKTWYPDFDKAAVTESVTLDSFGRPSASTNAKGDVTVFDYNEDDYVAKPLCTMQNDINRMYGLLSDSSKTEINWFYDAYPATVYQCDENDVGMLLAGAAYDTAYGVMTDKWQYPTGNRYGGEIHTEYQYDSLGRLAAVIYPPAQGENGDMNLKVTYAYSETVTLADYGNRQLFRVIKKLFDGSAQKSYSESYYDDYGNLLYRSVLNGSAYITEKYEFDAAGRLIKHTDFKGNYTQFGYDAFDRQTTATDMAGNISRAIYGTNTLETRFEGVNDGQQNHALQTFDIRGNVAKKEIFPSGRASASIAQNFAYDLTGAVKSFTDGKSKTTNYLRFVNIILQCTYSLKKGN
jgi:YD repeat-containing protein